MDEYAEKSSFADVALFALLSVIDDDVVHTEYARIEATGKERVTIIYRNGFQRDVNVTGDSLKAMAIDVLEAA